MNDYAEWLIAAHRQNGILVDTNILLLLLIGNRDPELISTFRRTNEFSRLEFDQASRVVGRFDHVLTLHSILTETSNLASQLGGEHRTETLHLLGSWTQTLDEQLVLARDIALNPLFPRFGLTDTAIIHVAAQGYLVFTNDFPLAGYLVRYELPVLNLNHLLAD